MFNPGLCDARVWGLFSEEGCVWLCENPCVTNTPLINIIFITIPLMEQYGTCCVTQWMRPKLMMIKMEQLLIAFQW